MYEVRLVEVHKFAFEQVLIKNRQINKSPDCKINWQYIGDKRINQKMY